MKEGTSLLDYYLVRKMTAGHKVTKLQRQYEQVYSKLYSDVLYISYPSQENARAKVDCLFSTTL